VINHSGKMIMLCIDTALLLQFLNIASLFQGELRDGKGFRLRMHPRLDGPLHYAFDGTVILTRLT